MYFATAGIEVSPIIPFGVAWAISMVCSISGISGAFLLLPWQVSFLGYTSPGVSATNQIFNILACPGGVWRYAREGRLLLPLSLFIVAGTLPGVLFGAVIRLTILTGLNYFMLFAAMVLFYLGWRLAATKGAKKQATSGKCVVTRLSAAGFSFRFGDEAYHVSSRKLISISVAVGLVGGIYGVGGGAIMVPFLVSLLRLPVHAIAGASLLATFITSLAGAAFYSFLSIFMALPQGSPDWALGAIMGLGGLAGMYCGARLQKFISARIIRIFLAVIVTLVGCVYCYKSINAIF